MTPKILVIIPGEWKLQFGATQRSILQRFICSFYSGTSQCLDISSFTCVWSQPALAWIDGLSSLDATAEEMGKVGLGGLSQCKAGLQDVLERRVSVQINMFHPSRLMQNSFGSLTSMRQSLLTWYQRMIDPPAAMCSCSCIFTQS
jgi:hypothetical protein